ncbi:alpha glucosidase 2 [Xylocopa sonorina]|uniref:alpha glucosidase 2 n=1 Tax=Xylocopa sonorina TaxID=1818115 RepID=UPI00403AE3B3
MKSIGLVVITVVLVAGLAAGERKEKGWWRNAVFYQVYPRSFMDSNGDGDGDLNGITNKLEHFKDLGVTAIWLSPINKSPEADMGYDISDFKDINPRFGTKTDLENLMSKAKKLGLKVILDLVPNHTSDEHEWFKKSVNKDGNYTDYYIWVNCTKTKDGVTPPNNWVSVFNNTAWSWNDARKQCYFHQFKPQQPDLNYRNPNVRQEMMDIMKYWLDFGMDGFRVDAVPHLFESETLKDEPVIKVDGVNRDDYVTRNHIYTKDQPETYNLVQDFRKLLDDYADNTNTSERVLLTEAYTTWDNTLKYYEHGSEVPFNFKFITDANAASNASDFKAIIDKWVNGTGKGNVPNWVMGNHDRSRVGTRFPGKADQMVMLEMILPGVAVTYYGEEIGMVDNTNINRPNGDFRDGCRTPFQWDNTTNAGFSNKSTTWLPVNSDYKTLNLAAEKADPNSHYNLYKSLIQLRNESNALRNGSLETFVLENSVLAAIRNDSEQAVALLINFSKNSVAVELAKIMQHAKGTLRASSQGSGLTRGDAAMRHISVSLDGIKFASRFI